MNREPTTADAPQPAAPASRVVKFQSGFDWAGVARRAYKAEAHGSWHGVSRAELAGADDATDLPFHVRYFEIEPGGCSSLERHAHQHVVAVIRGEGTVTLGERVERISFGDIVYVAPWETHQFKNSGAAEPLGFLCIVPADRDRPVVLSDSPSSCELD